MRTLINPIAGFMLGMSLFAAALPVFAQPDAPTPSAMTATLSAASTTTAQTALTLAGSRPIGSWHKIVSSDAASQINRANASLDDGANRRNIKRYLIDILNNNGLPETTHEDEAILGRRYPKFKHRS